ncbi:hypothetical protein DW66_2109 [Pseudomonas putida]|nr:hypothetical protein DW66_2109 [Pseudomonas putida]
MAKFQVHVSRPWANEGRAQCAHDALRNLSFGISAQGLKD